jgi:hypothetical protein
MLNRLVVSDVANEFGYAYVASQHGVLGAFPLNRSRVFYARNADYQARQ